MNLKNYCTLEYAQKLVEHGIVLETDAVWASDLTGGHVLVNNAPDWVDVIPAPCFQDVWNELPESFEHEGERAWLCVTKSRKDNNTTYCSYYLSNDRAVCSSKKHNANPTNAAIDLLIFVKENK